MQPDYPFRCASYPFVRAAAAGRVEYSLRRDEAPGQSSRARARARLRAERDRLPRRPDRRSTPSRCSRRGCSRAATRRRPRPSCSSSSAPGRRVTRSSGRRCSTPGTSARSGAADLVGADLQEPDRREERDGENEMTTRPTTDRVHAWARRRSPPGRTSAGPAARARSISGASRSAYAVGAIILPPVGGPQRRPAVPSVHAINSCRRRPCAVVIPVLTYTVPRLDLVERESAARGDQRRLRQSRGSGRSPSSRGPG